MLSDFKKLRILPRCQEPDSNLCRTRCPHVVNRLVRDQRGKPRNIYRAHLARDQRGETCGSPCL